MGTSDLEFHEIASDGSAGEALPAASTRRWLPRDRARFAATTLWALAAAAAIAAPFTVLVGYRETFRPDGTITTDTFRHQTDGWGRAHDFSSDGVVFSVGHEARFGIATCACAVLLIAAVAAAFPVRGWWRAPRFPFLAVVATALLGGAVAAEALQIEATLSQFGSSGGPSSGAAPRFQSQVGPCIWLGVAAVASAAAGLVVMMRAHASRVRLT